MIKGDAGPLLEANCAGFEQGTVGTRLSCTRLERHDGFKNNCCESIMCSFKQLLSISSSIKTMLCFGLCDHILGYVITALVLLRSCSLDIFCQLLLRSAPFLINDNVARNIGLDFINIIFTHPRDVNSCACQGCA